MEIKKVGVKLFTTLFIKALKISLKVRSKKYLIIGILGFFMALMPSCIARLLQKMTDEIQILYGKGTDNIQGALLYFAVLSFCYLLQAFWGNIQRYYSNINALDIQEYIKETVIRCACKVNYKYIDNEEGFLNKIHFVKTESGFRVANSIENVVLWFQYLIAFISMNIILLQVDIRIVFVLLITSIPSVALANIYKDEDYRRKTKWIKEGKLVIYQFHDCCAQYSLNEVRFFGIFNFLKNKWRENANRYIHIKNVMTKKYVIYNIIADFLRNIVFFIILILVVKQIFNNSEVGLGLFVLVMNLMGDYQKTATNLFIIMAQFVSDISYIQDFFGLEDCEYEKYGKLEDLNNSEIEFKDVTFCYPGECKPALHKISVSIREGEKVAIVGENGSGKTTFVNLILGLYIPDEGEVRIGNKKVEEALGVCRKNISAIFQNFGKYEMSILQNIVISDKSKSVDEKRVIELLRRVGLEELVSSLKNGLYEIIGSLSDGGRNLSGGQWQRIAIARTAYKEDAKIMILDEPTASLDPLAEAEIYRNFSRLVGEKTTVYVSHRLGISKIVDRILVFENGKIVEDGSHTELMKKNGSYAKMYRAQAQWYN